jgi:hypothetical protein
MSAPWIKHGKRRGYQQGCRLPCCVDAEKAYNRKRREDKLAASPLSVTVRNTSHKTGVTHEFERAPAKSKYVPSEFDSRGYHEFERLEPEPEEAPDISFAAWAKRRVEGKYEQPAGLRFEPSLGAGECGYDAVSQDIAALVHHPDGQQVTDC